jgi:hypothetical protein
VVTAGRRTGRPAQHGSAQALPRSRPGVCRRQSHPDFQSAAQPRAVDRWHTYCYAHAGGRDHARLCGLVSVPTTGPEGRLSLSATVFSVPVDSRPAGVGFASGVPGLDLARRLPVFVSTPPVPPPPGRGGGVETLGGYSQFTGVGVPEERRACQPWGWRGRCRARIATPEVSVPREAAPRKSVQPNVRVEAVPTARRQARAGENVPRTTGPGLVACRWASPRTRG